MSTPAKSFEDLRSILGKLDRKIDSARSRRLGLDPEPASDGLVEDGGPLIGKAEEPESAPAENTDAAEATDDEGGIRRRSPYGRAKPLNRGGSNGTGPGWLGGA
jgi:hypothetical protein